MNIAEFVAEKTGLERRIATYVQAEIDSFFAATGLAVDMVSVSMTNHQTIGGARVAEVTAYVPLR